MARTSGAFLFLVGLTISMVSGTQAFADAPVPTDLDSRASLSIDVPLSPEADAEKLHLEVAYWTLSSASGAFDSGTVEKLASLSSVPVQLFELEGHDIKDEPIRQPQSLDLWKTLKKRLKAIRIPSELVSFRNAIVPPADHEIRMGVVTGTYRLVTSSIVWFGSSGIHPMQAASMVLLQTAMTVIHSAYGSTFDRLFSKSFPRFKESVTQGTSLARRMIYSWFWAEAYRLISTGANGMSPVLSVHGQLAILGFLVTSGLGDALSSTTRQQAFESDKELSRKVSFLSFVVLAPLSMAGLAGLGGPPLINLGFYSINGGDLAMLTGYTAMIVAMRAAPSFVGRAAEVLSRVIPSRELLTTLRVQLKKACDRLLSPFSQESLRLRRLVEA